MGDYLLIPSNWSVDVERMTVCQKEAIFTYSFLKFIRSVKWKEGIWISLIPKSQRVSAQISLLTVKHSTIQIMPISFNCEYLKIIVCKSAICYDFSCKYETFLSTIRCRYNVVNFLTNITILGRIITALHFISMLFTPLVQIQYTITPSFWFLHHQWNNHNHNTKQRGHFHTHYAKLFLRARRWKYRGVK